MARRYSASSRFSQPDPYNGSYDFSDPQSLNRYAYTKNDPVNFRDPSGLNEEDPDKIIIDHFDQQWWDWMQRPWDGWGGFGGTGRTDPSGWDTTAAGRGGPGPQKPAPKKGPCDAPDFWDLSQGKQMQLKQLGASWEDWIGLNNNQRLGYFNITGAIRSAELSLSGWSVQEIQQDRVFFVAGAGANDLRAQARATHKFSRDIGGGGQHPGHNDSYRQDSFSPSLQLSFSQDGKSLDADLDNHNPNPKGGWGIGTILHGIDVLDNRINNKRTDPYSVAQRNNWECY
jgi:hypothetical protein